MTTKLLDKTYVTSAVIITPFGFVYDVVRSPVVKYRISKAEALNEDFSKSAVKHLFDSSKVGQDLEIKGLSGSHVMNIKGIY